MVFVNDLSSVPKLPWWTYHMPLNTNGMTYVDMVFPAFLFILGMSIPLAIKRRIAKGESLSRMWQHILVRSLSLVALGVFLENAQKADPQRMGQSAGVWVILAFVGALVLWSAYPVSGKYKRLYQMLKYAGLLSLVWFAIIFRRTTPDGQVAWLDFSEWEILSFIGWAYLAVGTIYLVFRKNVWALAASLMVLCTLNVFSALGWFHWLSHAPNYVWPFEAGISSMAMAGVLASLLFLEATIASTFTAKTLWAFGYAALLAGAGWALRPLGVSKELDTPSWCLYSSAANTLIFLLLYWIADVKRLTKWAIFAKPAGTNTLLTYLIPDVIYAIPGLNRVSAYGSEGWIGVTKALLFTSVVLVLSALFTRWKIRLQL